MDVEVTAGKVTALDLITANDFALARRVLARFFVAGNEYQYALGDHPLTGSAIEITKADMIYCGIGNTMISNTPEGSQLRLNGPIAAGTYLGVVAGIDLIAKDNPTLREQMLGDNNFSYTYIE